MSIGIDTVRFFADDADVDISEETETALRDEAIGGEEAEDGVQQSR